MHLLASLQCSSCSQYDPHTNQNSLVGDEFGDVGHKWNGGCLASDGAIYCFSDNSKRILYIDPWKEYSSSLENNIEQHPEQLGCIFNPSDDNSMPNETITKLSCCHQVWVQDLFLSIRSFHASCRSSVRHIQSLSFHDCSILQ